MSLQLSVCMIVRDAAALLPDALASVAGLVDEWVIVDTGSTDQTLQVIAEHAPEARVFELAWPDHFAEARNFALAQAQGRWLLVLDADERLSATGRRHLQELIQQTPTEPQGYLLKRLNLDAEGQPQSWDYLCRLVSNSPELRYVGRVHERLIHLEAEHFEVQIVKGLELLHLAPTEHSRQQKQAQYLALIEQARQETPCPFLDFHWVIAEPVMAEVPAAERARVLWQALRESYTPPQPLPHPAWAAVPFESAILELQHLCVESGDQVLLQEMVTVFEVWQNQYQLLAESWGIYALALKELQAQNPLPGRKTQIVQAFYQCLDPQQLVSDPRQGWNSWRPLLFLAEEVARQQPETAYSLALQALLSGPIPRFAQAAQQLLQQAGGPHNWPQWLQRQLLALQIDFEAQRYPAVLLRACEILPLCLHPHALHLAILITYRLQAWELCRLLTSLGLMLKPQFPTYQRLLEFCLSAPGGEQPPEANRLLQSLLPAEYAPEVRLHWQAECAIPVALQQLRCLAPSDPPQPVSGPAVWRLDVSRWNPSAPEVTQLEPLLSYWLSLPASRLDALQLESPDFALTLQPQHAAPLPQLYVLQMQVQNGVFTIL